MLCGLPKGSRATGSTFRRHHRLEISSRNVRVAPLQKRWDRLRAGMDLILDQRGADMADLPGGASGLLRDHQGKKADRLVTRSTPAWSRGSRNCGATSAQAAEEADGKTHDEEHKVGFW